MMIYTETGMLDDSKTRREQTGEVGGLDRIEQEGSGCLPVGSETANRCCAARGSARRQTSKCKTAERFWRGVLEVVEDYDGDTYRAVYPVRFKTCVYVLHAFQKKSKSGVKTSKSDLDLIRQRLADADKLHKGKGVHSDTRGK